MQTLFLYGNRVDGQLPGLGVSGPIEVNIAAYDFASFALAIVFLAFVTGVYSGFGGASRRRPLRILSAALFLSAWLVFIAGLSFALSEEGRSIFTSETLASSGSHVGSGFALGFYLAFAAVALLGLSHMIERSRVKRKGG